MHGKVKVFGYVVYDKRTEMPLAYCLTQKEVARYMGISHIEVNNILHGKYKSPRYDIFVDCEPCPCIASQGQV